MRALVIEDTPEVQRVVTDALAADGFHVDVEEGGETGLEQARRFPPDVVVLDIGLPGIDGVETCRRLRTFTDAYLIMLTARQEELDKVVGFAVGADDYLTKPFSPRELRARVTALLRRP